MDSAVFDENERIDINTHKRSTPLAQPCSGNRIRGFLPVMIILALCLLMRLIHLELLPAFCDELIHIGWATKAAGSHSLGARVEMIYDAAWQHGRFLHVFLLSWLPGDALDSISASRALSAIFGSSAVFALFLAGRRLRDNTAGFIAAGLYAICPYAVMHDRLALADPFLSALTAWIIVLCLDLAVAPKWRWWQTSILAALLFLAVATKVPGVVLFGYPVIALMLAGRKPRRWVHCGAAMVVAGAAVLPALVLFLRNNLFDAARIQAQVNLWSNFSTSISWIWFYWTPPVFMVAAVATVEALVRGRREMIALSALSALPIVVFASISTQGLLFPRYLLFGIHAGLLLVAVASSRLLGEAPKPSGDRRFGWTRPVITIVAGCFLWMSLGFDFRLATVPQKTELPAIDHSQYVSGLPSGYGSRECAAFLLDHLNRCADGAAVIIPNHFVERAVAFYLTEDDPGNLRTSSRFAGFQDRQHRSRELEFAEKQCLFLVLADGGMSPRFRPTQAQREAVDKVGTLLAEFPKPDNRIRIELYSVGPDLLAGPNNPFEQ